MRILLIHQNFPGQFRQFTPHLLARGHELVAICSHQRPVFEGVRVMRYKEPAEPVVELPSGTRLWHEALIRSAVVAQLCAGLASEGWKPDRILAHCGWGETLGLCEVWPDVPQILWPELWLRPEHGGYGVDPTKPIVGLEQHWSTSAGMPLPLGPWIMRWPGCYPPVIKRTAFPLNIKTIV